jgi:hypothetical protein
MPNRTCLIDSYSNQCIVWLSFLMGLLVMIQHTASHAFPEQLWEDYVLNDQSQKWIDTLVTESDEQRYFKILHAQSHGDLNSSASLLQTLKKENQSFYSYQDLNHRQLLLSLNRSSAPSAWDHVIQLSQVDLINTPYHPPVRSKESPFKKSPISSKHTSLKYSEIQHAIHMRNESNHSSLNHRSLQGLTYLLSDQAQLEKYVKDSQQLKNLLLYITHLPVQNVVSLFQAIDPTHWPSLPAFNQLSMTQIKSLLQHSSLTQSTYDHLLNLFIQRLSKVKTKNFDPYRLNKDDLTHYITQLSQVTAFLQTRHQSFYAHLLLAQLVAAERQGEWPLDILLDYLKLPQDQKHYHKVYETSLQPQQIQIPEATVNRYQTPDWIDGKKIQNYQSQTGFYFNEPPSMIIARHIENHLKSYNDITIFKAYLDHDLLYKMWSKNHILTGKSLSSKNLTRYLESSDYQSLSTLKILRFRPYTPQRFKRNQEVSLPLQVKGYKKLAVHIYMLNTRAYFKTYQSEVPLTVDLSGLEANYTKKISLKDSTELLQVLSLNLPELKQVGSYIVDIQAGDEKIRAIVHKGWLNPYLIHTSAGPELMIIDDLGKVAKDVMLTVDGRPYPSNASGHYRLPYNTQSKVNHFFMVQNDLTASSKISIPTESYQLSLKVAAPLIRGGALNSFHLQAHLNLNKNLIPLTLLSDLTLKIEVLAADETPQAWTIKNPKFDAQGSLIQKIQLPPKFRRFSVVLKGNIQTITQQKKHTLNSSKITFNRNQDLNSVNVGDILFSTDAKQPFLEVIGRNGEPLANQIIKMSVEHEHYRTSLEFEKTSDHQGRILLPKTLTHINHVSASVSTEKSDRVRLHQWPLAKSQASSISSITAKSNESLRFMWPGSQHVYLIDAHTHEWMANAIQIKQGIAQIKALATGSYFIIDFGKQKQIPLRTFGQETKLKDNLWFTSSGIIPHTPVSPMVLEASTVHKDHILFTINHVQDQSRLHIVASPYALDQDLMKVFSPYLPTIPHPMTFTYPQNRYGIGQILSEEMRYILKRKTSSKPIGNLAQPPSLLIHRLDQGVADSKDRPMQEGLGMGGLGSAGGRGGFGRLERKARTRQKKIGSKIGNKKMIDKSLRSWDFLAHKVYTQWAIPLQTLKIDPNSNQVQIKLPLKKLAGLGVIHIILSNGTNTAYQVLKIPNYPTNIKMMSRKDLRAPQSQIADTQMNVVKRKQRILQQGKTLTLPDLNSRWKSYETLESVYLLYERLLPHASLQSLRKLLDWPQLTSQEKYNLYSEIGCHETDFFLYHKDPSFFKQTIAPLMAQKSYLSFLEKWMLKQELSEYLSIHKFISLNVLEQILLLKTIPQHDVKHGEIKQSLHQKFLAHPLAKDHVKRLFNTALAASLDKAENTLPVNNPKKEPEELFIKIMNKQKSFLSSSATLGASIEIQTLKKDRTMTPQLYQRETKTRKWIEHRYFNQKLMNPHLIRINQFWLDYANHNPQQGSFLSSHFIQAADHFNSAWLALALLDLPFKAKSPSLDTQKSTLKITAQNAGIYYYEGSVQQDLPQETKVSIRREYTTIQGKDYKSSHYTPKEFRIGIPYRTRLMIMNPNSQMMDYELFNPIPQGAIMLNSQQASSYMNTQHIKMKAHEIKVLIYDFYFPQTGEFIHVPTYVTQEGQVMGASDQHTLKVVTELTNINQDSWADVARLGTHQEVLTFLRKHNPQMIDLRLIDRRLTDVNFYRTLIKYLTAIKVYDPTIWSYSLAHQDLVQAQVFMTLNQTLKKFVGPYIELPTSDKQRLIIDDYQRIHTQHIDFDPLTVARAHARGKVDAITHPQLKEQYLKLLKYLSFKRKALWSLQDRLALVYYLIKQGRLHTAIKSFKQINAKLIKQSTDKNQAMFYHYLQAYLSMSQGHIKTAQKIAQRYQTLSHTPWKKRFKSILATSDLTLHGVDANTTIQSTSLPKKSMTHSVSSTKTTTAQSIDFQVKGSEILIDSHQVDSVQVRFYPIDLEVLFSNNPESLAGGKLKVSPIIKPSFEQKVLLNAHGKTHFQIPVQWQTRTLQIEVKHQHLSRLRSYSPQSFTQHIFQQKGLLQIMNVESASQGIAGAYLKVYVKLNNGRVRFHKDGYTDHRGIFDYINANPAPALNEIKKFIILTLTQDHGASIRTIVPPAY